MLTKSHSQGNQKLISCRSLIDSSRSRGSCSSFRICRTDQIFPAGRGFFRGLSDKLTKAICLKCTRVSSSSSSASPAAAGGSNSKRFVAPIDVHREEAIEDCIEFINHSSSSSSSSLPRSNSVSV